MAAPMRGVPGVGDVDIAPEPYRDAVALALVMCEDGFDSDAVANDLVAVYGLTGPTLKLILELALLASRDRDDADEFFYGSLSKGRPQIKGRLSDVATSGERKELPGRASSY